MPPESESESEPSSGAGVSQEQLAPSAEHRLIADILERIAAALGLEAVVEVVETDDELRGTLHGRELGLFIGRHGQTIDAVQHIVQRAVATLVGEQRRVSVDAERYRARRQDALEREAADAADAATASGEPVALHAMTASERRLVHEFLRDRDDVETHSVGDEPDRHLVVSPVARGASRSS